MFGTMKTVVLLSLILSTLAAPQSYDQNLPQNSQEQLAEELPPPVRILKDERIQDGGKYAFDIETEDGIVRSEAGSNDGAGGTVVQAGQFAYTMPDGQVFELKFVADENGFQPQSDFLPVAPEFPHPIPDFVLEQIERAKIEDAQAAAEAETQAVSGGYEKEEY